LVKSALSPKPGLVNMESPPQLCAPALEWIALFTWARSIWSAKPLTSPE
jgi:hypothetical protein